MWGRGELLAERRGESAKRFHGESCTLEGLLMTNKPPSHEQLQRYYRYIMLGMDIRYDAEQRTRNGLLQLKMFLLLLRKASK